MTAAPDNNIGLHADNAAILARAREGVDRLLQDLAKDGRTHPTNLIAILMSTLASELGKQARILGRPLAADDFILSLRALTRAQEPTWSERKQIARNINATVMKLVGVNQQ